MTTRLPGSPLDLVIAVGLFLVGIVEVAGGRLAEDVVEGSTVLNVIAVTLGTLPLAWRRRAPFAVALIVFGAFAGRALADAPLEIYPTQISMLFAIWSVAAHGSLREAVVAGGVLVLALAVGAERGSGGDAAPQLLPAIILAGGIWAVGRVSRVRHDRALDIERGAEERAAAAAAEERARLARELHDAVSHSLASIVMQAGGAQDVLRGDPDRASAALGSIERTAREGLGEMRRLLGLLGGGADGDAPRDPQPGLARLEELITGARDAGLDVRSDIEGAPRPLPPAVDLSAFRIVQEALTNAMKHGGRCRASVTVRYGDEDLALEVADDGRGTDAPASARGAGRGLAGMRERVGVLGGEFDAGPGEDGRGFRVRARLPLT